MWLWYQRADVTVHVLLMGRDNVNMALESGRHSVNMTLESGRDSVYMTLEPGRDRVNNRQVTIEGELRQCAIEAGEEDSDKKKGLGDGVLWVSVSEPLSSVSDTCQYFSTVCPALVGECRTRV